MQNLLELKGVSRRVSDRFSLRDVTLTVEPGQIVGFVGANGAGKTTTIRAALGLIKLDAGEVHLFGQHCGTDAPGETQRHLRSRIGLVLDTCPFPSTLKVGQIETLVGPAHPTWSRETFARFIERFGLDPKAKVKDLSRGMGMKLQLACALSHNARLLVLDEATAGLDPMAREELLDELLAFEIGDGLHVRVGRYGPYLEDMNHLDDEGNPKRASLPDTLAPDELTVEVGHDLIENHSGGPRALGVDPVSGGTVEVRNGRFGPYVALVMPSADAGDAGDAAGGASEKPKRGKGAKKAAADRPKMASLFKTMSPESLTLDDALRLLSLPREVGSYEEVDAQTGEVQTVTVQANTGRYGPYLTKTGADGKSDTRSLASEDEIFTVDLDKAKELFAQPKYGRGRGRGAAKPPLRELGVDPETQKQVTIKEGFYGAYITDGETNRTLPKQYAPESIEPAEAFRLLAEKRAQGPSKRRGRKTAAGKGGAKKAGAAKASKTSKAASVDKARADRRAKVRELADKGWANTRIAKEIGSTPTTVKADVEWLAANEGYTRPAVVPAR